MFCSNLDILKGGNTNFTNLIYKVMFQERRNVLMLVLHQQMVNKYLQKRTIYAKNKLCFKYVYKGQVLCAILWMRHCIETGNIIHSRVCIFVWGWLKFNSKIIIDVTSYKESSVCIFVLRCAHFGTLKKII